MEPATRRADQALPLLFLLRRFALSGAHESKTSSGRAHARRRTRTATTHATLAATAAILRHEQRRRSIIHGFRLFVSAELHQQLDRLHVPVACCLPPRGRSSTPVRPSRRFSADDIDFLHAWRPMHGPRLEPRRVAFLIYETQRIEHTECLPPGLVAARPPPFL